MEVNKMKQTLANYLRDKRFEMARKYIESGEERTLLEIGCDKDKAFLKKLNGMNAIGLDLQLGTKVEKALNFPDRSFDYVVMIATIEHIEYPKEVLKESSRVLKDDGSLIITTPKDTIILHMWEGLFWRENLQIYPNMFIFDKDSINEIASEYFELASYETFEFGLNQLFVYQKTDFYNNIHYSYEAPLENESSFVQRWHNIGQEVLKLLKSFVDNIKSFKILT